jgi:hypothetical protein
MLVQMSRLMVSCSILLLAITKASHQASIRAVYLAVWLVGQPHDQPIQGVIFGLLIDTLTRVDHQCDRLN